MSCVSLQSLMWFPQLPQAPNSVPSCPVAVADRAPRVPSVLLWLLPSHRLAAWLAGDKTGSLTASAGYGTPECFPTLRPGLVPQKYKHTHRAPLLPPSRPTDPNMECSRKPTIS